MKCNTFARNEVRLSKAEIKLWFQGVGRNLFARNDVRSSQTGVKLRVYYRPSQPFRTKWGSIVKYWERDFLATGFPKATGVSRFWCFCCVAFTTGVEVLIIPFRLVVLVFVWLCLSKHCDIFTMNFLVIVNPSCAGSRKLPALPPYLA